MTRFFCVIIRLPPPPIQDTRTVGPRVDVADDYAILAERMIRLMIEVSVERERRARGTFSEPQPYLRQALTEFRRSQKARPHQPRRCRPYLRPKLNL